MLQPVFSLASRVGEIFADSIIREQAAFLIPKKTRVRTHRLVMNELM